MPWSLSRRGAMDLRHIILYTRASWGPVQAVRYLHSMHELFDLLTTRPLLGRPVQKARRPTHRIEHESHVVFYRTTTAGILIDRIYHKRQLPTDI